MPRVADLYCLPQNDADLRSRRAHIRHNRYLYRWDPDVPDADIPYVEQLPSSETGGWSGTWLQMRQDFVSASYFVRSLFGRSTLTQGLHAANRWSAKALKDDSNDAALSVMSRLANTDPHSTSLGYAAPHDANPFAAYVDFLKASGIAVPSVAERWYKDSEFARQRLLGSDATMIRRVRPSDSLRKTYGLFVTEADVEATLERATTLRALQEEGRLFVTDFRVLDGFPISACRADIVVCAPVALFYLDSRNTLLPLAIQLSRAVQPTTGQVAFSTKPPRDPVVFVPTDPPGVWLTAKIHVQSSGALHHAIAMHLVAAHRVLEVLYTSMRRNLLETHPISELLAHHFWFLLRNNARARYTGDGPHGIFSRMWGHAGVEWLRQQSYAAFHLMESYHVPTNMRARGVGGDEHHHHHHHHAQPPQPETDTEPSSVPPSSATEVWPELKDYFWRDDAIRFWAILHEYVSNTLTMWYQTDDDVERDEELQGWLAELRRPHTKSSSNSSNSPPSSEEAGENATGEEDEPIDDAEPVDPLGEDDSSDREPEDPRGVGLGGVPASVVTIRDLIEFITAVLYGATGGHSSVNDGPADYLTFIPNQPYLFKLVPPTCKPSSHAKTASHHHHRQQQPQPHHHYYPGEEEFTDISLNEIAACLPRGIDAQRQLYLVHTLRVLPPNTPLGGPNQPLLFRPKPELAYRPLRDKNQAPNDDDDDHRPVPTVNGPRQTAVRGFQQRLSEELVKLSHAIDQRNRQAHVPYEYLNPKWVPQSVTV